MTIELHINGVKLREFTIEDIREGATEAGGKRWNQKIRKEINKLKSENWELLEFNEYEFYIVYPSAVNNHIVSWDDMLLFERQAQHRRNGEVGKKKVL